MHYLPLRTHHASFLLVRKYTKPSCSCVNGGDSFLEVMPATQRLEQSKGSHWQEGTTLRMHWQQARKEPCITCRPRTSIPLAVNEGASESATWERVADMLLPAWNTGPIPILVHNDKLYFVGIHPYSIPKKLSHHQTRAEEARWLHTNNSKLGIGAKH